MGGYGLLNILFHLSPVQQSIYPPWFIALIDLAFILGPTVSLFGIFRQDLKKAIPGVIHGLELERLGCIFIGLANLALTLALLYRFNVLFLLSIGIFGCLTIGSVLRWWQIGLTLRTIDDYMANHADLRRFSGDPLTESESSEIEKMKHPKDFKRGGNSSEDSESSS